MTRTAWVKAMGRMVEGVAADEARCSMCGTDAWSAVWIGHATIFLCHGCAVQNLAGLFVDTVWHEPWADVTGPERTLEQFKARFYRAVAIALAWKLKEKPRAS